MADEASDALELVVKSFKCPRVPEGTGAGQKLFVIDYNGNARKFSASSRMTESVNETEQVGYEANSGEFKSFLKLLSFRSSDADLIATCKTEKCIAHSWVNEGCINGICGNISINSAQKEYVDSATFKMCDAEAAKDAADALSYLADRAR
ncbi:hypothetical protein [Mesorhizobium sp. B2-8-9]|uniref:hypothetical protein n=1 Tax=Mesorhizobium sp. B2-8-9 TaxID=2589899 RepID=UPI00112B5582|nr:hypothetical protein [Mesorhizobium sp. B2-8-9]TPI85481.1 hypothetical protein FJ423_03990 [Mesorhizobium sp. B2-8-9]